MAFAFSNIFSTANNASGGLINLPSVVYAAHDRSIIPFTYGNGTTLSETISDGTNTYSLVPANGHVNIVSDSQTYVAYECKDCAAGTFTIGATPGSSVPFRALAALVYSGLDNAAAAICVSQLQSGPGTGANAVTSPNLTPLAQPGALIAFTVDDNGNASSISANTGGGFTDRGTIANWDSIVGVLTRVEDKRIASLSAAAATFTANGNGGGNFPTFAIYIPESGGGGASALTRNYYDMIGG